MLRGLSAQTIIKRLVCPRHVIFLSLLIINTSLSARRTRTRVIGGYDSTREGDRLRELLGEGQEVLDFPTKLLKPTFGLMGGWSLDCSLLHFCIHTILSLTHSHACAFMHPINHSLIHPHLRPRLGLGREPNY
jgi:hypothetical protein